MTKFLLFFNSIIFFLNSLLGVNIPLRSFNIDAQELSANVSASCEARIEAGTITGAHAIVTQNGNVLLNQTYGFKGVGKEALSENAVYRIASMTKPVAAVALLIEQDRGHLNINDDLSDYLPEFKDMYVAQRDKNGDIILGEDGLPLKGEKAENAIKLYQLVSHFSGIGEVNLAYTGLEKTTVDSACEWLATQPLRFEPGSQDEYSTGAFDVAAKVIEKTSGMEFSAYIKENIFDKLGMTDTTFEPSEDQWNRMVEIHSMQDGKAISVPGAPNCVFGNFPCTYHAAGAALASTASDYAKFAQMLVNNGVGDNGTRVLSEDAVKQMRTPVKDDKGTGDTRWGLAVRVIVRTGNTLPAGCFGWSGAYGSHFWVDPTNHITAVYMKNSAYDGGAGNMSANEFEKDVINSLTWKK